MTPTIMHYDCHMLIRKNLNTTFAPNSNNKKIIPLEAQEPLYFKNDKKKPQLYNKINTY